MKIKICDIAPGGGCSLYRGIGVLSKLNKLQPDISSEYITGVGWHTLADGDILFLTRPVTDNYKQSIELAKNFGVKVWIDYDDCMAEIPPDNPAREGYARPSIQKNIKDCMELADVVTVTTQALKDYYSKIRKDIIVIENAFNDYNFKFERIEKTKMIVNWRGSNTHRGDLLSVSKAIIETAQKHNNWVWSFLGNDTWYITDHIMKKLKYKEMETVKYFHYIRQLTPAIQLVPLVFNVFNECKSNIGFQEATYSGAATVAPDMPEFRMPGISTYVDEKEFQEKLEKLIIDIRFRDEEYNKSYEYIKKNLMLSQVNKKRIEVIKQLFPEKTNLWRKFK